MDSCSINLSIPFHMIKLLVTNCPILDLLLERNNKVKVYIVTMARARIIFRGKVQGVWFRANCQKKALELGLKGWVRNLPEGSVEALVEGPRLHIHDLIEWNRTSQPFARVDDVMIEWEEKTGDLSAFYIRR